MHCPQEIMADVPWIFEEPKFSSQAEFVDAVHQYHRDMEVAEWQPETIVLRCLRVRVEHDYGEESEESSAEFTADSPIAFTEGELLFKAHNAFVEQLQDLDHCFFEGFSLLEQPESGAPPVYEIDLGS